MEKAVIIVSTFIFILTSVIVSGFFLYNKRYFNNNPGILFHSVGKDFTKISLLSKKQYNNMTGFKIIDDTYYENIRIKFIYKQLNNFIKDEYDRYDKEDEKILKKVKTNIKYFETLKNTKYKFHYIKKGASDNEMCIYSPTESKGYCIIQHI